MTGITSFYEHPPANGKPQQAVFLLHGLGADGRDLLGLAQPLAQHLPQAVFISPDAPFPCDMAPMGHQWFSLQDWSPASILKGIQNAAPILNNFIAQRLQHYGIVPSRCALLGFSQGTMMSLYVGPRYPEKLAGILGYSGALVWEPDINHQSLHKIPVFLVHGQADTVVPVTAYHMARTTLESAGFTVEGQIHPFLMHGIDEQGIESGAAFLKKILL